MPKNKGRHPFFFFMIDWKKRAEAQGRKFPNGLKDVQQDPDCNAEWQSLIRQEKTSFEVRPKKDKISLQLSNRNKKTSFRQFLSIIEQKEKETKMFIKNMQENIKVIIDSAVNLNFLPQLKFCFVHVNWFFSAIVNNTPEYFPAEYAFGIFSLQNGIEDVHHAIVSAEIPLGYRRKALEISQNGHNIPVECEGGETDFAIMYEKLINFLESRKLVNQYPYLYTTKDFAKVVRSLITKLSDAAHQDKEQFKIYEMESLFVHLANKLYKKREDRDMRIIPILAETIFKRYTYIFEKGFQCHFHKYVDEGSEYCSKSVLQHWAWTLCNEFCEPLEISMQPGVHYPEYKSKHDFSVMTNLMSNLTIKDDQQSISETNVLLSMSNVSEQHRLKVTSKTHQEEMHRRNESKPVINCSKLQESSKPIDESINKSVNKSVKTPIEEKSKYVSKYLNEKPLQSPNIDRCIYVTSVNDFLPIESSNKSFPPIGGRGVFIRSRISEVRKLPLGKGQGHS